MGLIKKNMKLKRFFAFVLICILAVQISIPVDAKSLITTTPVELTTDSFVTSETAPQRWKCWISENKIYIHMYDDLGFDVGEVGLMVQKEEMIDEYTYSYDNIDNIVINNCFGKKELEAIYDVSNLDNGKYYIAVGHTSRTGDISDYDSTISSHFLWSDFDFIVCEDEVLFSSLDGGNEQKALNYITQNCSPSDYLTPDTYGNEKYDDIAAFTKRITSESKTDAEKVRVIHDWVCTNLAYDYESYYSNDLSNAANPSWVYTNGRGVCDGFARLYNMMLQSVGIPSMRVTGHVSGAPDMHAWSMVYYNGIWHIFDTTWNCRNKYYGNSDSKNVNGIQPSYKYYDVSGFTIGSDHQIENGDIIGEGGEDFGVTVIELGESMDLRMGYSDISEEYSDIKWESSNEQVVSIDSNDVLRANGLGYAVVTGKVLDRLVFQMKLKVVDSSDGSGDDGTIIDPTEKGDNVISVDEQSSKATVKNAYTGKQDTVDLSIIEQSDIYRMYNTMTAEHLYTKDACEVE